MNESEKAEAGAVVKNSKFRRADGRLHCLKSNYNTYARNANAGVEKGYRCETSNANMEAVRSPTGKGWQIAKER